MNTFDINNVSNLTMWTRILETDPLLKNTIDKNYVHKYEDVNNFLYNLKAYSFHEEFDIIITKFNFPQQHLFFYEQRLKGCWGR